MPEPIEAALSANDITVKFHTRTIVAQVSLVAEAGRVTGILGPNGAGKTTLLKALVSLVPYQGSVLIAGRPVSAFDRLQRAREIAYVPQRSLLASSLAVRSVVAMGRYGHDPSGTGKAEPNRTAVEHALREMDVVAIAERDFLRCSGGEQQRVLLARALATGAGVLVLDEPTANLDIRHRLELHAALRRLTADGRAIIAVFHDLEEARTCCDAVVLLSAGRAVARGDTADVLSDHHTREVFGVRSIAGGAHAYEAIE